MRFTVSVSSGATWCAASRVPNAATELAKLSPARTARDAAASANTPSAVDDSPSPAVPLATATSCRSVTALNIRARPSAMARM